MTGRWWEQAACKGRSALFENPNLHHLARPICAACPVLDACRRDVLEWEAEHVPGTHRWGFVAGMTATERHRYATEHPVWIPGVCHHCHRPFRRLNPRTLYCTNTCRQAAHFKAKQNAMSDG